MICFQTSELLSYRVFVTVTNGSDETPDPAPTAVTTETAPTGEKKKKKKKEKAAAEASTASESTLETTLDQSKFKRMQLKCRALLHSQMASHILL